MITKKDYLIGAVVGFFTGALALVILHFLQVSFLYETELALVGIPILFAAGVWFGGFLGRFFPFFTQFGKYAAAGFLSTVIDFSTLNFVSALTGVTAGITIGWVNVPGFLIAVFNGYLWNKLWVFGASPGAQMQVPKAQGLQDLAQRGGASRAILQQENMRVLAKPGAEAIENASQMRSGTLFSDFPKFVVVAVTGLLINSGLIVVITTYIHAPLNLSPQRWLNVAKVFASIVVILWNFTGFKFFVFSARGGSAFGGKQ